VRCELKMSNLSESWPQKLTLYNIYIQRNEAFGFLASIFFERAKTS